MSSQRVSNKVAIITGAAGGLGEADARLLASQGAKVVLADINIDLAQQVATDIGDSAIAVAHDVCNENSWQNLINTTQKTFGQLDILINNAGIVLMEDIETCSLENFKKIQAVNVEGVFLGCQAAIKVMKQNGGSIINMSSIAGIVGTSPFLAYSASKGAVRLLTKSVARHCVERNYAIRCNSVHPAGIATPMTAGLGLNDAAIDPNAAVNNNGMGEPIDVANMVLFLASDEAKFINGTEMLVDNAFCAG